MDDHQQFFQYNGQVYKTPLAKCRKINEDLYIYIYNGINQKVDNNISIVSFRKSKLQKLGIVIQLKNTQREYCGFYFLKYHCEEKKQLNESDIEKIKKIHSSILKFTKHIKKQEQEKYFQNQTKKQLNQISKTSQSIDLNFQNNNDSIVDQEENIEPIDEMELLKQIETLCDFIDQPELLLQ